MKTTLSFTKEQLEKAMTESGAVRDVMLNVLFPKDTITLCNGKEFPIAEAERLGKVCRDGNMFGAIRELRPVTGLSLKEAKDAVEGWATKR